MSFERYKSNPFIENMVIPKRSKTVKVSALGKDDNVLVNQSTGEVKGTHVTTYKTVDSEQFLKLFTQNIGLTFDLSAAGIKALNVLMWSVQHKAIGKDQVDLERLTLEEFLDDNPTLKLSLATLKRGLNDLEKNQIIAKSMKMGRYFFNPNFMFNGDRIAFTTVIEKAVKDKNLIE